LGDYLKKPAFRQTYEFVKSEYESQTNIFPPKNLIFNAFNHVPFSHLKVVIVG
jgi:uracil-DNA glycosylase